MYIVAIIIELKSTFSCLLGYLLFNYLSLCSQLPCMHYNINPTLLIQGIANDNANVTCSFLTEVGATNSRILQPLAAPCIMLLRWLVVTLFCVILLESVLRYSALFYVILLCTSLCQTMLFCVILCYTCCWLSSSKIEIQSRWGSSGPVIEDTIIFDIL